jgi:hypothetical protein
MTYYSSLPGYRSSYTNQVFMTLAPGRDRAAFQAAWH